MSVSRRFFMYGAGALVTPGFATRAAAYAERTGRPLLITPDAVEGELHFFDDMISLGPPEAVPTSLTWLEYLTRYEGAVNASDVARLLDAHGVDEEWLDREIDLTEGGPWCPFANAYRLLDGLGLGPIRRPSGRSGWLDGLEFVNCNFTYVAAKDPVVRALLQARLIELGTGLKLVQ